MSSRDTAPGPRTVVPLAALLFALVGATLAGAATSSPSAEPGFSPALPLAQVLNADGSLNLRPGFSGSLDPTGFAMATDATGAPRFVPAAKTSPPNAPRTSGGPDDNWDGRFFSLGGVNK